MNVTVLGIGKLGAPFAAVLASAGHRVFCVDPNEEAIDKLRRHEAPVPEPGLQELIDEYGDNLELDTNAIEAVTESRFVFIIVPTPSTEDGSFSTDIVCKTLVHIAAAIKMGARPNVVVTSTVSPGSMESVIVPKLEDLSGRQCGVHFSVCYSPHFIALGSVVKNMQEPDFILVGGNSPDAYDDLGNFWRHTHNQLGHPMPPIAKMSLINAELTKLGLNCAVTTKLSWANAMGLLCETIPGADAAIVCKAIGMDTRIGGKYFQPGGPYAGDCFPRDNRALRAVADTPFAVTTDTVNQRVYGHIQDMVEEVNPQIVAILGLAFKPGTPVTTESLGIYLCETLRSTLRVHVQDQIAKPDLPIGVKRFALADAAVCDADVVVIATSWPEYAKLKPEQFKAGCRIIDVWRVLDESKFKGFDLIVPGRWRDG